MGKLREFYLGRPSFGGGLSLPSSISSARQARKHYRKVYKKEARKRKKAGTRGKRFSYF